MTRHATSRELVGGIIAGLVIAAAFVSCDSRAQSTPAPASQAAAQMPQRASCWVWEGGHKSAGAFSSCDIPVPPPQPVQVITKEVPVYLPPLESPPKEKPLKR